MGGIDVTSAATVPADQRSGARSARAADGVVAGLAVAAAAVDAVCGDAASDVEYLVADGDRVAPGRRRGAGGRADPRAAHGRAHRAQPAVPPVGRGHADAALGRRPRRAPAASSATPARRRPACGRWRSTPCAAAAGANHRMGLADAALVKDNHVLAAGGVAAAFAAVRALEATIPVEIEVDSLDGLRIAIDAGADTVLLDNFDLDEHARRRRHPRRVGPARAPRGERRPHAGGRPPTWARPASTTSPSASSPTRPGCSTSASTSTPSTLIPCEGTGQERYGTFVRIRTSPAGRR